MPHVVSRGAGDYGSFSTAKHLEIIYGIDLKSFEALGGPFHYFQGGPFPGPNDVSGRRYFCQVEQVKVGSSIEILNHSFRVAGIVEHGRGARKFLPMNTLQGLIGSEGKASAFYLNWMIRQRRPAVGKRRMCPGWRITSVRSMREYLSHDDAEQLSRLGSFIDVVIGVSVVIG